MKKIKLLRASHHWLLPVLIFTAVVTLTASPSSFASNHKGTFHYVCLLPDGQERTREADLKDMNTINLSCDKNLPDQYPSGLNIYYDGTPDPDHACKDGDYTITGRGYDGHSCYGQTTVRNIIGAACCPQLYPGSTNNDNAP